MSDTQHKAFMNLACRLSPENLHCDGEISRAQANSRYRQIMKEWRALEKQVGHKVHEDYVWSREFAKSKKGA